MAKITLYGIECEVPDSPHFRHDKHWGCHCFVFLNEMTALVDENHETVGVAADVARCWFLNKAESERQKAESFGLRRGMETMYCKPELEAKDCAEKWLEVSKTAMARIK